MDTEGTEGTEKQGGHGGARRDKDGHGETRRGTEGHGRNGGCNSIIITQGRLNLYCHGAF